MTAQTSKATAAAVPAHTTVIDRRGKPFAVLADLPHLPPERALATVVLPHNVYWSGPALSWQLADPTVRAEAYRTLLREGTAADIATFVDGDLLLEVWDDLFLPAEIRDAWQPTIDAGRRGRR